MNDMKAVPLKFCNLILNNELRNNSPRNLETLWSEEPSSLGQIDGFLGKWRLGVIGSDRKVPRAIWAKGVPWRRCERAQVERPGSDSLSADDKLDRARSPVTRHRHGALAII